MKDSYNLHHWKRFPHDLAEEVDKKSKLIKEAEKSDVHVIDEGFLEDVKKGGASLMITSHSIASWGSDVRLLVYHNDPEFSDTQVWVYTVCHSLYTNLPFRLYRLDALYCSSVASEV